MTHRKYALHLRTMGMMFRGTAVRTKGSTGHRSRHPSKLHRGWRNRKPSRLLTRLQFIAPGRTEVQMERAREEYVRMVGRRAATKRKKRKRKMTMWTQMVILSFQGEVKALELNPGKSWASFLLGTLRTAPLPICTSLGKAGHRGIYQDRLLRVVAMVCGSPWRLFSRCLFNTDLVSPR